MVENYDDYAQELWQMFKQGNKDRSMKINWKNKVYQQVLYYNDLKLNEAFRLTTGQAIYIKVLVSPRVAGNHNEEYGMLEIATGMIFAPSKSPVELIHVEINVDLEKPSIYK